MIGTTFQINEARPYTEGVDRKVHVRTMFAKVTNATEGRVFYTAEIVDEANRPSFATDSGPISGEILMESFIRRFHTGEWQILSTPGLA